MCIQLLLVLQTNRLTERFNQTLSRCLAMIVDEDKRDWDEKLDTVLMSYHASRHAGTYKAVSTTCFFSSN